MTLLFVLTPAFNPTDGGVQRTTYKLGKYFTERGIDVVYFSFSISGHIKSDYGTLFHAPSKGNCDNIENLNHLEFCIRSKAPDVVINQMPYEKSIRRFLKSIRSNYKFVLLGCLRNSLFSFKSNVREISKTIFPKIIFRMLDNKIGLGLIRNIHKVTHAKQLKEIISIHDRFILLTPNNLDELLYFIGNYKTDKILSIPNSIPEVFDNLPNKDKTLLFVGRMNIAQKRADLILPIWEKIFLKAPDWKFVIVGDGPYLNDLKVSVNERKVENIVIVGHDNAEKYYVNASIFLMTSAYEGFPNVIIEAQSYGVVPVAFDTYASLSWIVNHDKDSFLIEPYDCESMSDHILSLIKDPMLLKSMCDASIENARRFTIDNVGKHWLNLFEKLELL